MSRLGDEGVPCACEADILGTLSMHAALLASGAPAGLADWNNLAEDDDEVANIWHCGVFPASFAQTPPKFGVQEIIASSGAAKYDDSQCTVEFVAKPGPLTLCRVTQDPEAGWHAVIAEGRSSRQYAVTFGGYGWCRIPNLQRLYRDVLAAALPAPRCHHPRPRGQRALGGTGKLPRHERLSRRPGLPGAVYAAAAVLEVWKNLRRFRCEPAAGSGAKTVGNVLRKVHAVVKNAADFHPAVLASPEHEQVAGPANAASSSHHTVSTVV